MKKLIILLIVVLGGSYLFFKAPEAPEDFDDYEEEEYTEYTESSEESAESPPPPVAKPPEKKETPPNEKIVQKEEEPPPPGEVNELPEKTEDPDKKQGDAMVKAIKNFTPQDLKEVQEYYGQLENQWKSVVKNLIGENDYAEYEAMREEFQKERKESFVEFHKSMIAKHGEKHVYSPIEYEKQVGKKIQEAYFERFRERFGPEAHKRYRQTLQRFNGEAKRNQDPAKGLLKIFF